MEIKDIFGWTGRTVTVDLSSQSVYESRTNIRKARNYLGGRGLGVKMMSELVDPRVDPLQENNLLIFATGPLTGTSIPMSGHCSLITKSPLTKTIFDSNTGGYLGKALKAAGIDLLIIKGKADAPIYLYIYDEDIEFISAQHIWGKNTRETTKILQEKGNVACIGRAGELQISFANLVSDNLYSTGRGGHGAVAGSKKLKAIVVKGTNDSLIANQRNLQNAVSHTKNLLMSNPVTSKGLAAYGTSVIVDVLNYLDILPALNFREINRSIDSVSTEKLFKDYISEKTPCIECPLGCKRIMADGNPMPEYDALWAFGPGVGNQNIETIVKANNICYLDGVDPISCGATIAAHIEKTGHLLSSDELIHMVSNITQGRNLMGKGSRAYLQELEAENLSMSSKGLEMPGYDPRSIKGLALAYATSNKGACCMNSLMIGPEVFGKPFGLDRLTLSNKSDVVKQFQDLMAVFDSLIMCPYAGFALDEGNIASFMTSVTGIEYTATDIMIAGERIWNLERMFNQKAGFTPKDDSLPNRLFSEDGISKDDFEQVIRKYYKLRGWGSDGIPTDKKLKELGIATDYY